MEVIKGLSHLNKKFKNPVVTIGTFDGIHIGHRKIIKKLISESKKIKGTSIVITFNKRPKSVFMPYQDTEALMTPTDKIHRFKNMGVNVIVIIDFNRKIAKISPETFIRDILYKRIGIKNLIVGSRFKFGKNRKGDIKLLKSLSIKYNFKVTVVNEAKYHKILISSTRIRQLVKKGEVSIVSRFLPDKYSVSGYIVKGNKQGAKIGFPTANVKCDKNILIPYGIYSVYIKIGHKVYKGICNSGVCPTFNEPKILNAKGRRNIIEVYIFNFNKNVYKKYVKVIFIKKIRNEKIFTNVNDLIRQINKDINIAKRSLSSKISLVGFTPLEKPSNKMATTK